MQIVYLSDRPDVLTETLGHVRHFAPFITDIVIICPAQRASAFASLGMVLTDEDITGRSTADLAAMDHSSRNFVIRSAMSERSELADHFICSDDDSRPLVPIDKTTFIDDQGRYRRRFFHTLADWRYASSDFDQAQLHTWVILRQRGFSDPLCYASHMPQVFDKALWRTVSHDLASTADRYSLDEWSTYFTIAPSLAPDRFAAPEPFVTLGWPQYPGEWPHQITPPRHVFENFHGDLYAEGGLYAGLPTTCDPSSIDDANIEKIMRWHRLERQVRELDFPDDVDQPWSSPSQGRKLAFRGLKAARSAYRYINLDERARITELEGRLHQLEQRVDRS